MITDVNRIGDIAEHYAITYLWDNGYEVFKNCGCTGPVDLIAMAEDGTIILIDVKTTRINSVTGSIKNLNSLTDLQKELGVQVLGFDKDSRKLEFVRHRHETTYSRYRDEQQTQLDLDCSDAGC
jgi:Holliday junction resolvase